MRWLFLLVSVILIGALVMGCSSPAPTTSSPAKAPATSAAPQSAPTTPAASKPAASTPAASSTAAAVKVTTLKWGHYAAPSDVRYKDLNYLTDRTKVLTNGSLELKMYPSEQLVKTAQELEAVMGGTIDLASLNPDYFTGKLTALHYYSEVIYTSPGYLTETIRQTSDLLDAYFATVGLKFISGVELQPVGVVSKKKLLKGPEDCVGMKIRAPGNLSAIVQRWGASPVSLANPEVYMALQQGVVDGALTGYGTMVTQKLWEVTDYVTPLAACTGCLITVMNMNTWNSLTADQKKAVQQAATESYDLGKKNAQDFVNSFLANDLKSFKDKYVVAAGSADADKWWGPSAGQSAAVGIKEMGAPGQAWWDKILKIVAGLKAQK